MVWASKGAEDVKIAIDNVRFASSSVSVSTDNLLLNNVVLYPNPFSNPFTIDATQQTEKINTIHIFNSMGELVKTTRINEEITTISTSDLVGGMYFMRLSSSDGKYVVKKMFKR